MHFFSNWSIVYYQMPYTERSLYTFVALVRVCSFSHKETYQMNQTNGFSEYFTGLMLNEISLFSACSLKVKNVSKLILCVLGSGWGYK